MAETAAILPPDKPVIVPEVPGRMSMADMVHTEGLEALKAEHPQAVVVSYVNTTAAVKAISDICCTTPTRLRSSGRCPQIGRSSLLRSQT
jgi:quinolinate synthase